MKNSLSGIYIKIIYVSIFCFLLLFVFLCYSVYYLDSNRMEPIIQKGSLIISQNFLYDLENEDVVLFSIKNKMPESKYPGIGKIIAKEGDSVYLKHGIIYVNGVEQKLNYEVNFLCPPGYYRKNSIVIPPDSFYIISPTQDSNDSRSVGLIKQCDVIGKIVNCILIPD